MVRLPMALIERQHGLVTTDQLRADGLSLTELRWVVESDRLERVSPRVLRLQGAPRSEAQRVLAAVLDAGPGSALSHTSALAWYKVAGFLLDDLHVTHTRDGVHRPRRLATHLHDKVLLPEHHHLVIHGIPVVTPARALFDIAGMRKIHPARLERAVDNAWAMRLVSGRTLHAMLSDLARRGRAGIKRMRAIVAERGADYVPPASGLERRVEKILRDNRQRPLRRQVDTGDEICWIGRIDFSDERVPFRLEVQSERFHASLSDQRADRERRDRLTAAGFVLRTVTDVDVWQRPQRVVEMVREGRRQAQLAPVFDARTSKTGASSG